VATAHTTGGSSASGARVAAATALPPRKPHVTIKNWDEEEAPKNRGFSLVLWVLIAIAAVFLIRYLLQDRVQKSLEDAATNSAHPRGAAAGTDPKLGASTAKLDYNPRGLDPSRSGRLRLELDGLPNSLPVSLDVDGKAYWSGTPESAGTYSGFLIATGRHEMRLVASGGAATIVSNSVGADFTAGKRALLSAQVRPQAAAGALALERGARITLTVRPDTMLF
jgi:hypothetical protein